MQSSLVACAVFSLTGGALAQHCDQVTWYAAMPIQGGLDYPPGNAEFVSYFLADGTDGTAKPLSHGTDVDWFTCIHGYQGPIADTLYAYWSTTVGGIVGPNPNWYTYFRAQAGPATGEIRVRITDDRASSDPRHDPDRQFVATVKVVKPAIARVDFAGAGLTMYQNAQSTNPDHTWTCDYMENSASALPSPNWQVGGNNEPGFFTGGQADAIRMGLKASDGQTHYLQGAIKVQERCKWSDGYYFLKTSQIPTELPWGSQTWDTLQLDEVFPPEVFFQWDYPLEWSYRTRPTDAAHEVPLGTSTHSFIARSLGPVLLSFSELAKKRVQLAAEHANEAATTIAAAEAVRDWLAGADPPDFGPSGPYFVDSMGNAITNRIWCALDAGSQTVECDEQALLMEQFIETLGVAGEVVRVRPTRQNDPNCLDMEALRTCPYYPTLQDKLQLLFGGVPNNFEGVCRCGGVEAGDYYAVAPSATGSLQGNRRGDLDLLYDLNAQYGVTQAWGHEGPEGWEFCEEEPLPNP